MRTAGYKGNVSVEQVLSLIEEYTTAAQRGKLNGTLADLLVQEAESNLVRRIDIDRTGGEEIITLLMEDFVAAARVMRRKRMEQYLPSLFSHSLSLFLFYYALLWWWWWWLQGSD